MFCFGSNVLSSPDQKEKVRSIRVKKSVVFLKAKVDEDLRTGKSRGERNLTFSSPFQTWRRTRKRGVEDQEGRSEGKLAGSYREREREE